MSDDFVITALPALRVVTPGAKVTYTLTTKTGGNVPAGTNARWLAVNDPKIVSFSYPAVVQGPTGTQWQGATWSTEGHHRVVCIVSNGGTESHYEYEQWVAPLVQSLVGGPHLSRDEADPDATLDTLRRYVDVLGTINKQFPPTTPKDKESFEKTLKETQEFRDKLTERLQSTQNFKKFPIQAEHFDSQTQTRTRLRAFICKVESKKWIIVDWTNPTVRAATGEYEGYGNTSVEAVHAAFDDWDSDNRYPAGGIAYHVPNVLDLPEQTGQFTTDGSAFWDSVSAFFGYVGLAAAVVAGVVTLVAPVPGSQVVSAAIWTAIFSSTAAAAINIGTRIDEGFSSWKANAFDILTIVANIFGGTGMLWSKGATLLVDRGGKVVRFALIGAVTTDGVQGVMLATDYVGQFDAIQKDPNIPPQERTKRLVALFTTAAANAALLYINVKGTKTDLQNLNLRGRVAGDLTPAERLHELSDPKATVDLTKIPRSEGSAATPVHTTRVGVDQEIQSVHAGAHTQQAPIPRKLSPKGPQHTASLDELYKQAAVAKQELDALTTRLAGELGGTAELAPLKGRGRAERKIREEYTGDASQILDLARTSLVFKTMSELRAALAKIQATQRIRRIKNRFDDRTTGYRDVLMNLEMSNGHIVEMQLHLEAIIKVKTSGGHDLYVRQTAIIDQAKKAGRTSKTLTAAERQQIKDLDEQMNMLYDAAFNSAQ